MAITIPVIIFTGVAVFILNTKKLLSDDRKIQLLLLIFTILFPLVFVILKGSNLYGSWRHFLFVYPGIVLIAALGFYHFFIRLKHLWIRIAAIGLLLALSFHPMKFMVSNHPYYYLYYNQFVGGLKGAYGKYETDFYYHSMRKGAEWLQEYLKYKPHTGDIIVGGNFPVQWYFRNDKTIRFVYFPYLNRSDYDWDYAIIANSYISPFQLKNKIWPPANTIHTINADGVPICAVIERLTKDDLEGLHEIEKGDNIKSALLLQKAIEADPQNEWICYKFAETLAGQNQNDQSVKMLQKCLEINPDFEPALIMLGDEALISNNLEKAATYFRRVIVINRKYLDAYVQLAGVYSKTNVEKTRLILKDCLKMNSRYKPALQALAETYRKSSPGVARRYDELINTIK
jgi:tetratricopeptide (TPR) repeat protein